MSDIKKYKVIAPGLDNYSVGEIIELTDAQAAARVNKVELCSGGKAKAPKAPVEAENSPNKPVSDKSKPKAAPKAKRRKAAKGAK